MQSMRGEDFLGLEMVLKEVLMLMTVSGDSGALPLALSLQVMFSQPATTSISGLAPHFGVLTGKVFLATFLVKSQ